MIKRVLGALVLKTFPDLYYYISYCRADRRLGDRATEMAAMFDELVRESQGLHCLQIGVRGRKYASHWVSVDLYDHSALIDHNYDLEALPFDNGSYDRIACNAILEHVEHPCQAIKEMYRVLKTGGRIWVEVPFNQPFHPSPEDHWRTTLSGLRIWMSDFHERSSGYFRINHSRIYNGIFFYGEKRAS